MSDEYRSLKKQHYLNLIRECARSGKNKREWCSENEIKYSTYMRWEKLLRDEVAGQLMEKQSIVPVRIAPPVLKSAERCSEWAADGEISIEKGAVTIRFPASVSADYLVRVIKGIQEC